MKQRGPWRVLRETDVYADPWIRVQKDDVLRPDGHPGTYTVVHLKSGVSVLAMDDAGSVYLTEEFHYGVDRVTLEVASGGIEIGEDALQTARRELEEELGISANRWTLLGVCDPFTASVVSPTHLYLAQELMFGIPQPEGTEQIRCVGLPLEEAVERVLDGRITHAPSCLAILMTAWRRGAPR
ncbi:MAG: NUDIX domain-containing protein [Pirellulaceae bacterium]